MIFKIVVLLFTFGTIIMVIPITAQPVFDKVHSLPEQSVQLVQQVADRLGNAYVSTYDQEKVSVDKTLNTFKDLGQKTVESGVSLLKNGLEFLFIMPTFGRNAMVRLQKSQTQVD